MLMRKISNVDWHYYKNMGLGLSSFGLPSQILDTDQLDTYESGYVTLPRLQRRNCSVTRTSESDPSPFRLDLPIHI
jgi:hypothetical protein